MTLNLKSELHGDLSAELNVELNSDLTRSRLDIIVYGDMNSEPATHFLGYARLARIQAVFWGNPITTGKGLQVEIIGGKLIVPTIFCPPPPHRHLLPCFQTNYSRIFYRS